MLESVWGEPGENRMLMSDRQATDCVSQRDNLLLRYSAEDTIMSPIAIARALLPS